MEEDSKQIKDPEPEHEHEPEPEPLLKSSYSIDEESFIDSDFPSSSHLTASNPSNFDDIEVQKRYLTFLQAVKDDNCDMVSQIILSLNESRDEIAQLCTGKGAEGIYPIQYAALFGNSKMIQTLISHGASTDCTLEVFSHYRKKSYECFKFLLQAFPQLKLKLDRLGRTLLHVICQYDLYECLEVLEVSLSDLFVKDFNGENVLQYIYTYNSLKSFEYLCEKSMSCAPMLLMKEIKEQCVPFIEKCCVYNALGIVTYLTSYAIEKNINALIEILIDDFSCIVSSYSLHDSANVNENANANEILTICLGYLNQLQTGKINTNECEISHTHHRTQHINKTMIVFNNFCLNHGKLPLDNPLKRIKQRLYQVENPDRICVLLQPPFGILLSDFFIERFIFNENKTPAALTDILRCHDFHYVDSIKTICEDLVKDKKTNVYKYDSDTYINSETWESALYAAGCVMNSVDRVMTGECSNVFALIRPPGHHAGYFGKVEPKDELARTSNGFCFFNNVAIGAAYCKNKYRDAIKKIAIVDFDVHHGNGTEEIVKLLQKKPFDVKFENKLCNVNLTKTICNPWLEYEDPRNVLFTSIHSYDNDDPRRFYPSSGSTQDNTPKTDPIYPGGIFNVPVSKEFKYSHEYRKIFRGKVIPRLIRFQPDIIFLSAGFDGHEFESINMSYMKLNETDFRWITEEVMKVAMKFGKGRVISVLEGGYNINAGITSSFAQSVMTHAKFLNISANKKNGTCAILSKGKRQREYVRDYQNFQKVKKLRTETEADADADQSQHNQDKHGNTSDRVHIKKDFTRRKKSNEYDIPHEKTKTHPIPDYSKSNEINIADFNKNEMDIYKDYNERLYPNYERDAADNFFSYETEKRKFGLVSSFANDDKEKVELIKLEANTQRLICQKETTTTTEVKELMEVSNNNAIDSRKDEEIEKEKEKEGDKEEKEKEKGTANQFEEIEVEMDDEDANLI